MPHRCGVVGCSTSYGEENARFFSIPGVLSFVHKVNLNALSALRRKKWFIAIRRADLTASKIKNLKVCYRHFITGNYFNYKI